MIADQPGAIKTPLGVTQASYRDRFAESGGSPLNVTLAIELPPTHHEVVTEALAHAAHNADVLRAVFDGEFLVADADLSARPQLVEIDSAASLEMQIAEQIDAPTELNGPLWSALHFRGKDRSVVSMAFHHMIFDGLSRPTLLGLLNGDVPKARPYSQYAEWQHREFEGAGRESHLEFWERELAGLRHNEHLGLSFVRNLDEVLVQPARESTAVLAGRQFRAAAALARTKGVSLFTLVLAALSRATVDSIAEPRAVMRVTFHGRPPGFEQTIGCFAHDVAFVLRDHGDESYGGTVSRTSQQWDSLGKFRFTPYAIVREAAGRFEGNHRPVALTLNAMRLPESVEVFGTHGVTSAPVVSQPEEGLHIAMVQQPARLSLVCSYSPQRFLSADVESFLERVLSQIDPSNA